MRECFEEPFYSDNLIYFELWALSYGISELIY